MIFCLDAGHCLLTPERRCLKSLDPNETQEWTLNNRIANYIKEYLKEYDCETVRVDDITGQTEVSLQQRVNKANNLKATAYISIHHNIGIKGGPGGGIIIFKSPSSSDINADLQKTVYKYTTSLTGLVGNRAEPLQDYEYYVLKNTEMPAILGEFGFMDSATDVPIILSEEYAQGIAKGIVNALVEIFNVPQKTIENNNYKINDNLYIIPCAPKDVSVVLVNELKKNCGENTINAGFFGNYAENGELFTLPVGHLKCDYEATSEITKYYCTQRGFFDNNKFTFDSSKWSFANPFYHNPISTLCIDNNEAKISKQVTVPTSSNYVISGLPIILNGNQVTYEEVQEEGWDSSPVRATWHSMIGLKPNDEKIYIIGWKSTSSNLISSGEAYNEFKNRGFNNLIKLDGGGSFYLNVNNVIEATEENRRINSIIRFIPWVEPVDNNENSYDEDTSQPNDSVIQNPTEDKIPSIEEDNEEIKHKIILLLEKIIEKLQIIVDLIKKLFN